ncbi:hypothetical protein VPH35_100071 [Triticum aestivum]
MKRSGGCARSTSEFGVDRRTTASGRMDSSCSRRRSGGRGSGSKAEHGTTMTGAAWRRGAAATGAGAATSAGSTGTSSASARSCGKDRRRSRLSWPVLTLTTTDSSRPWLRGVCWNKPRRVWSGSSGASGARGTGGTTGAVGLVGFVGHVGGARD